MMCSSYGFRLLRVRNAVKVQRILCHPRCTFFIRKYQRAGSREKTDRTADKGGYMIHRTYSINTRQSVGNLHIALDGEFNGMCAWALLKAIRRHDAGSGRVFINTEGLRGIVTDGISLFKNHMTQKKIPRDWLYFKGEKGFKIAPDGSRVLISKKDQPQQEK